MTADVELIFSFVFDDTCSLLTIEIIIKSINVKSCTSVSIRFFSQSTYFGVFSCKFFCGDSMPNDGMISSSIRMHASFWYELSWNVPLRYLFDQILYYIQRKKKFHCFLFALYMHYYVNVDAMKGGAEILSNNVDKHVPFWWQLNCDWVRNYVRQTQKSLSTFLTVF